MRKLKVRGCPGVLVPNPRAIGANPPRFVGKALVPNATAETPLMQRYREVVEEHEDHAYLRLAIHEGSLAAGDEETAKLCGVRVAKETES